ncbi:MAG: hypothetical protein DI629_03885 [Mesorhizobium amorphae]|nr:MAG: hypothetical protein DI629_03885 [Mesorhizobium amorphae]
MPKHFVSPAVPRAKPLRTFGGTALEAEKGQGQAARGSVEVKVLQSFGRFGCIVAALALLGGCTTLSGSAPVAPQPQSGVDREAIIAALGGGLVGGTVGTDLSGGEKRRALEAEYRTLEAAPAGERVAWQGDSTGRRGEVVAAQPYRVGSQDCRQFSQTVFTPAGSRTARGTACRAAGGSWSLLN